MSDRMKILVTGGKGFIGSAVVRHLINHTDHEVVNVDKMTYAATDGSTQSVADSPRLRFEQADICDIDRITEIFAEHAPDAVMHLAAESHVDRSIDGPAAFIQTNLVGTFTMLEAARAAGVKRFHHISTDEVFGSLGPDDPAFTETTPYDPRSPYSASKAGSDHLVRAWGETYGLPVLLTNCSNNYGPFHFPEKLIPLVTIRALHGEPLPVYGKGDNIRDWLHVEDHAAALVTVVEQGTPGETYNIGGKAERTNLEVVETLCDLVDELAGPLAVGRDAPLADHLRHRPARPRPPLRHRPVQDPARAGLGTEAHLRHRAARDRPVVHRQPGVVAATARQAGHRTPRPEEVGRAVTMEIIPTALDGVVEIRPARHGDDRGWFSEVYKRHTLRDAGIDIEFVQDNESFSAPTGTLRGLHYQLPPHAQDKLVRVIHGSILDVAVDIRRGSATFGQHVAVTLTADLGNQLLVPAGFAHGFCTLEPDVRVAYKVSGIYAPDCERAIRWDDPALAIEWQLPPEGPTLSGKDAIAPLLADQPDLF